MIQTQNLQEKLLKNYFRARKTVFPINDQEKERVLFRRIASLTFGEQIQLIKEHCKRVPKLFVLTFLSNHIQTGNTTEFHDRWIQKAIIDKIQQYLIISPRGHAKSTIISLATPLWFIVYGFKRFITIVSDSSGQSQLFLGNIRRELEENQLIQVVYGNLVYEENKNIVNATKKWSSKELLTTNGVRLLAVSSLGRVRGIKDMQNRPDLVIIDDIESETDGEVTFDKVWGWFTRTLLNIGSPKTQWLFVGTLVNAEGLIAKIKKAEDNMGWTLDEFTMFKEEEKHVVIDALNNDNLDALPDALWSDYWTREVVKNKITQIGKIAFRKEYLMDPEAVESEVFIVDDIEACLDKDLSFIPSFSRREYGHIVYTATGVDLAISQKKTSDDFALITVGVTQEGTMQLLKIIAGKFRYIAQKKLIQENYSDFEPLLILVENNAYQDSIVQDIEDSSPIPIEGESTGVNKRSEDIGINSLPLIFKQRKIVIPYNNNDLETITLVKKLIGQMKRYPKGHTGDILVAFWRAITAARRLWTERKATQEVEIKNNLYVITDNEESSYSFKGNDYN